MGAMSQLSLSIERRTRRNLVTMIRELASVYRRGGEIAEDPVIRACHASTNVALKSVAACVEASEDTKSCDVSIGNMPEQKIFEDQVAFEVKERCLALLRKHRLRGVSFDDAIALLANEPFEEDYAFVA